MNGPNIIGGNIPLHFTRHAVQQMFQRHITEEEVKIVMRNGEVIKSYEDDKPYPSYLIFHYINNRPLHVVAANSIEDNIITIITAYEPSTDIWEDNFKARK
ncbi:MAG TPA: DUF4258 domain-containing protein [Balneolaceae bacterium]|nr:DUF4258 domain-containing protein [Balneolaceae bacterium]